jgi:hypothetical protein
MATGLVATVLTVVTGGTELGAKGEIKTKSILADRMPRMAPYAAKRGVSLLLDPLNPIFWRQPALPFHGCGCLGLG